MDCFFYCHHFIKAKRGAGYVPSFNHGKTDLITESAGHSSSAPDRTKCKSLSPSFPTCKYLLFFLHWSIKRLPVW